MIVIDQSPIGKTPRSNPATYTKVFDEIRTGFRVAMGGAQQRYGVTPDVTTVGKAIVRLNRLTAGDIRYAGQPWASLDGEALRRQRSQVQIVFQDPYASLDPRMRVADILMEGMASLGVGGSSAERLARVDRLLDQVGLPAAARWRYPHEFSGGQRQRICIARALALNPKVVISDEAVSALDVSIQAQIINLLIDLQQQLGVAFLFISHDMAVVERISHRVAVMYLGQIVEIGPRRAIFQNPQHPYTRKLMSAVPIADPARRHLKRELSHDEVPSPIRALHDEPVVKPLVCVGPDHYVARHRVGGLY